MDDKYEMVLLDYVDNSLVSDNRFQLVELSFAGVARIGKGQAVTFSLYLTAISKRNPDKR